MAESPSSLIYAILPLIRWLVLIVRACGLLVRIWREVRRRPVADNLDFDAEMSPKLVFDGLPGPDSWLLRILGNFAEYAG